MSNAHRSLEGKGFLFTVLVTLAVLVGGIVEIVPMFAVEGQVPAIAAVQPYTPLEVEGRDIYVREGCYNCHSQMVRPFRAETERYGTYSRAGEFVYDHPFQWGSKRTGPDLHRVGGKYNNKWHYQHMQNPRVPSPGSLMPAYEWLMARKVDFSATPGKLGALRAVGVPYDEATVSGASAAARAQGQAICDDLAKGQVTAAPDDEIIALIAYLQRLGTDIRWRDQPQAARESD